MKHKQKMAIFIFLIALVYLLLIGLSYHPAQTIPLFLAVLIIFILLLIFSRRLREFFKNIFRKKHEVYIRPPQSVKESALRKAHWRCQNCGMSGREVKLEVHHIVPISKGGTNKLSNLTVLCPNCHSKIPSK